MGVTIENISEDLAAPKITGEHANSLGNFFAALPIHTNIGFWFAIILRHSPLPFLIFTLFSASICLTQNYASK
jgi:hypothetical protein